MEYYDGDFMKKAIINTTIVMPDYLIPNGIIVIEDGKIVDFGKKINTEGIAGTSLAEP